MRNMLFIVMGILFLCSGILSATIINVPNDYPTIQQGIDASQVADTVLVQPGTYIENINYNGKNITVASLFLITQDTSYISQTIIDGNQQGSVVTFENGEDTIAVLCGFTVQNGNAEEGGGIYCYCSNSNLSHLWIKNNTASGSGSSGGGIFTYDADVKIENSKICNNMAYSEGGGIQTRHSSNINISNSLIAYNTCLSYGAGINNEGSSSLIIINSEVSFNSLTNLAHGFGGGIMRSSGILHLYNVYIHDNYSTVAGGGLACWGNNDIMIYNTIFESNSSFEVGGGIYGKYSDLILENVIFKNNNSQEGGALFYRELSGELINVNIHDNYALEKGGGIYLDEAEIQLINTTIKNNNAYDLGGGIYFEESFISYGEDKSSIYLNEISSQKGSGFDLYAEECTPIPIIMDTFTVINPTDHYASPVDIFTFDIQHGLLDSLVNSDFYVSVNGNNSNSGITPEQPVKTISYALSRIYADSLCPHTIFLEPGIYSPSTNEDIFPLYWNSYVSLQGAGCDSTILNADSLSGIIRMVDNSSIMINDITIKNAIDHGIYCVNSDLTVNNVLFLNNSSVIGLSTYGGAIYCKSSTLTIEDSGFLYNFAKSGAAIHSQNSYDVYINNSNFYKNYGMYSGAINISSINFLIENIIIDSCSGNSGGGLSIWNSNGTLSNTVIKGNIAEEGGGIDLGNTNCSFENVIIKDNYSNKGGGIYGWNSNIQFIKTTIKNNNAEDHYGGIYCFNTPISFDPVELSNIYSNTANHKGSGIDIFTNLLEPVCIYVDTFTVINPTDHYASPIDQFSFNILHGKEDSLVNADLYVAVDGDNSNDGLSADNPLKTISYALSRIYADSILHHTIFLAPGIYSSSTNGENFPVEVNSFLTITGSSPEEVILDADSLSNIFNFTNVSHGQIYNMTIQNGEAERGGGIYIRNSNPMIRNTIFRYNHAEEGGAVYSNDDSHPQIINCTFHHCSSSDDGGAIYCDDITLNYTLFYRNSVGDYGIICFDHPSAGSQIQNVTMTNNYGLAIQVNIGYLEILNSILWNDGYSEIWGSYTNDIYVTYSDIQGGYSGSGNIRINPIFNDPSNDDYYISWSNFPYSDSTKSPCIDKGNPATIYNDPDGTRNDMGWKPYYQIPYGTISGQVALNGPFGSVDEVLITADTMSTFPDEDGLYTLPIWIGNYDVAASHCRYQDSVQVNVPVLAWSNTNDINFALQLTHQGPVWHIATDGSDSTGTGSLQYPFLSIQQGINIASDNDTILIHPGVYHECINYNEKNITVASEFIIDHDSTYIFQTIINGDSLGRVVTITNSGTNYQFLIGLTIENGNHSSGAGICCMNSHSILSNLIVQDCIAQIDGGGILLASTQAEISEVKILSCRAQNKGGGMRSASSSARGKNMSLVNCSASYGGAMYANNSDLCYSNIDIINNEAHEIGGAFFGISSVIDINNATFQDNIADSLGGVLFTHSSDMYIANSMLNNNSASIGGGIYSINSDYEIINSTLYGNNNIGIYCENQSEVNVINDILWQNNPQQIEANNANVTVEYSDIENGFTGTGNINENPLFIDTLNSNFHFSENSPCINSGTPDTTGLHLPPWDLDGNPRIYDGRIDMGAYEWQGVAIGDTVYHYDSVTLHQNFPNPFSSSTHISYSLPHPEKVKIQIYNLKGQLIETLLDENKPAGNYSFEWNADDMGSGIYFCKLSTNKKSSIQKLMIIK